MLKSLADYTGPAISIGNAPITVPANTDRGRRPHVAHAVSAQTALKFYIKIRTRCQVEDGLTLCGCEDIGENAATLIAKWDRTVNTGRPEGRQITSVDVEGRVPTLELVVQTKVILPSKIDQPVDEVAGVTLSTLIPVRLRHIRLVRAVICGVRNSITVTVYRRDVSWAA